MPLLTRLYAFKFLDAFILIYPLYAVMFLDAGLTPGQIGLALAVWSVTAFVLEIPAGVIAARSQAAHELAYFSHLKLGLSQVVRSPALLDMVGFIALAMALGGALDEFWTIFASQAGLPNAGVAIFLGLMSAGQAAAAALAHRASNLQDRWFYLLFALCGGLLAAAAALFQPAAVILLIGFSAGFKVIDTVFEGRLQHAIPDETRATLGSVKGFAVQVAVTALYLTFGPLAQATSYPRAFLIFGAGIALLGGVYLIRGPLRAKAPA